MSSTRSPRTARIIILTVVGIGLAAGAAYVARRSTCETDRRAVTGEVKRVSGGTLLYFDGQCWTTKPVPPTDTPF